MALFGGKEDKEDKKEQKALEMMSKYGLENLTDEADRASVKKILSNLMGNSLITFGTTLQGKGEDSAKLSYLAAIVEQNWIIIRQLDKLNNQ